MKQSNRWLVLAAVLGMFAVNAAQAGAISCGVHIIKDSNRSSATKSEVLKKCGKPKSSEGDSWIYSKGGRETEVNFKDGKVQSIH
jgi:predicted small secreted protein